ncbi:MAG: AzlD domain-containing protein [Lachnospiraceae bacterium]|nr:AzlD domain-containing protein [Lachnospiraceae bacterium]
MLHDIILVLIMAAVTAGLRFVPFVLFPEGKPIPKLVQRLSRVLPCAVMGMLLIYCLKGVSVISWPFGLPELIAMVIVAACYVWKRNTLISILAGTLSYMVLIQTVFLS